MRIQDVMKRPVESIETSQSVATAIEKMRRSRIHHLVVTRDGAAVGVLSEGDVRALELPAHRTVDEVMTAPVVFATPEMTLRKAANLLRGRTIGCLPVLQDGRVVGIVTTSDLLEKIGRGAERPVEKGKRWILKDRGPRPKTVVGRRNYVAH
jgi:acetoin utilization protein AcuB